VVASNALVYSVDLRRTVAMGYGSAVLRRITELTGGRYFRESRNDLLQVALDDLHASFAVTYHLPSRAVGFHSLRILPKHNLNLRFHCRAGYYYQTASP
jgi:hypothetical protein